MNKPMLALASVLGLLAGSAQAQTSAPAEKPVTIERISAEDFGALPFLVRPILSPDGRRVLAKAFANGRDAVIVIEFGAKTEIAHGVPVPDRFDLNWYRWAGNNRILSRDGKTMLVWTGSSSDPGRFYVFLVETGKMFLLARPYERLRGKKLATMESTSYRARDGVEIPAYVTMPPGREPRNLPLILMPHGGPFARDEWGYDVWVQFLAKHNPAD